MSLPTPSWLDEAIKKYRQKLSHVKLRPQLNALIPQISNKTAQAVALNDRLVSKVRAVLDAEGVLSDFHPSYVAYGLALDKSQRTMEFMVDRIREHQILRARFEAQGCDSAILDKLDSVLIFNRINP